jgi:hypothetical protein
VLLVVVSMWLSPWIFNPHSFQARLTRAVYLTTTPSLRLHLLWLYLATGAVLNRATLTRAMLAAPLAVYRNSVHSHPNS